MGTIVEFTDVLSKMAVSPLVSMHDRILIQKEPVVYHASNIYGDIYQINYSPLAEGTWMPYPLNAANGWQEKINTGGALSWSSVQDNKSEISVFERAPNKGKKINVRRSTIPLSKVGNAKLIADPQGEITVLKVGLYSISFTATVGVDENNDKQIFLGVLVNGATSPVGNITINSFRGSNAGGFGYTMASAAVTIDDDTYKQVIFNHEIQLAVNDRITPYIMSISDQGGTEDIEIGEDYFYMRRIA